MKAVVVFVLLLVSTNACAASRYWVGGTDTWNATPGSKWATTSGGAGGAGVPTKSDDVYFDANSGSGTVTLESGYFAQVKSFNATGFTGTLFAATSSSIGPGGTSSGDVTLGSGMTLSGEGRFEMNYNVGTTCNITTNGVVSSWAFSISSYGAPSYGGGDYYLQDNLSTTALGGVSVADGVLHTNNYSITAQKFEAKGNGGPNGTDLFLGTSVVTAYGTGQVIEFGNTTITRIDASDYELRITDSGATTKSIATVGQSLNDLYIGPGTGKVQINSAPSGCSFNNITIEGPVEVEFTHAQTVTIVSGFTTVGSGVSMYSSFANTPFTLSKTSGAVNVTGVTLRDSTATGGAVFTAINSTDVSGNTGWIFTTVSTSLLTQGIDTIPDFESQSLPVINKNLHLLGATEILPDYSEESLVTLNMQLRSLAIGCSDSIDRIPSFNGGSIPVLNEQFRKLAKC